MKAYSGSSNLQAAGIDQVHPSQLLKGLTFKGTLQRLKTRSLPAFLSFPPMSALSVAVEPRAIARTPPWSRRSVDMCLAGPHRQSHVAE